MSSTQFNTVVFTEGLIGNRLKLLNRMRRMSQHHSDALSLGIIDGQGHRIRFLNDLNPNSKGSIAESIRNAIDSDKFDEALKLVAEQIKKGEVVFEKHSKEGDKTITAFAKKEVIDRIKTMKLHDKTSGEDVGYSEIAELQQDQLQLILEAAETILPEKVQHKAEKAAATQPHATKEPSAAKAAKKPAEEKEPIAPTAVATETDEAPEDALKTLQKAGLEKERKQEKREEAKKEEAKIQEKELNREILKQEAVKAEIADQTLATEEAHKEVAAIEEANEEPVTPLEPATPSEGVELPAHSDDEPTTTGSPKEVP